LHFHAIVSLKAFQKSVVQIRDLRKSALGQALLTYFQSNEDSMLLHFLVTFAATPQSTAASTCRSLDVLDLIDRMLVYDHAGVPELLRCDESAMNDLQNVERNFATFFVQELLVEPEAQRILPKEAMQHSYFAQIRERGNAAK